MTSPRKTRGPRKPSIFRADRMLAAVEPLLRFPKILWVCGIAFFVLYLPSLGSGFFADDYLFLTELGDGWPREERPVWRLFEFSAGDPAMRAEHIDQGQAPWWTSPEFKIQFFRPLSAWDLAVDYELFGAQSVYWHIHSLLLGLFLLAGVALFFRATLPKRLAAFSLGLMTVAPFLAVPVVWISNRNAVLSVALAVWSLLLHMEWRNRGWKFATWLSVVVYAAALSAGETAVAVFPYLIGLELVRNGRKFGETLRGLLPLTVLLVLYGIFYVAWGYGAAGSGAYVSPLSLEWISSVLWIRWGVLAGSLGGFGTAPAYLLLGMTSMVLVVLGYVGACFWGVGGVSLQQTADPEEKRPVAAYALGMVLSLVPMTATLPDNRLLVAPGLGASVFFAFVIMQSAHVLTAASVPRFRWWVARIHGTLAIVVMLVVGPATVYGTTALLAYHDYVWRDAARHTDIGSGDNVIVANAPDLLSVAYFPFVLRVLSESAPESWYTLAASRSPVTMTAEAPGTFVMTSSTGSLFDNYFRYVMRSDWNGTEGRRFEVQSAIFEPLSVTSSGGLERLKVTFTPAVKGSRYKLVAWKNGRLETVPWPSVGETLELSADEHLSWL